MHGVGFGARADLSCMTKLVSNPATRHGLQKLAICLSEACLSRSEVRCPRP